MHKAEKMALCIFAIKINENALNDRKCKLYDFFHEHNMIIKNYNKKRNQETRKFNKTSTTTK